MTLSQSHLAALEAIRAEWNKAEEDIKLAEQVCGPIIIPAIKELRYAGRRLVDLLYHVFSDPDEKKIQALLDDARFDCLRARHDAIDAATTSIAFEFSDMVQTLGYGPILQVYPSFAELVRELQTVQTKIAESRKNRENREAIYEAVVAGDFKTLVDRFRAMKASQDMMKALAAEQRKRDLWAWIGVYIGLPIGFVGLVLGVWTLFN